MNIQYRSLELTDYNKGFLQIFFYLTNTPLQDVSFEQFGKIFYSLDASQTMIMVAEMDYQIVGTGKCFLEVKFSRGICTCAHIEDIVIHPLYQKMGIGRTIVEKLIAWSIPHKVYKIILDCEPEKEAFYQKIGFTKGKSSSCMSLYF